MTSSSLEVSSSTTVDAIAKLALASALPVKNADLTAPYAVLPDGSHLENLEDMLIFPARKRGDVTTTDAESFIFYVKKHGIDGETVTYADINTEKSKFVLLCVLNDHTPEAGANAGRWRDHRCAFSPALSVEWVRWTSKNRSQFSQAEFAAWLEDNLADIATVDGMPTGADILTMALGFEANANKRVRSQINLQSGGKQFEYIDDEDKDTRTSMKVFERFTLGLPVFEGGASAYPVEARLKYREKDGRLMFWYELVRPDKVFKAAVTDDLARIRLETGFPVISGTP